MFNESNSFNRFSFPYNINEDRNVNFAESVINIPIKQRIVEIDSKDKAKLINAISQMKDRLRGEKLWDKISEKVSLTKTQCRSVLLGTNIVFNKNIDF